MSNFKRKLSAFAAMMALISISSAALAVNSSDVIGKTSNAQVTTSGARTDINVIGGSKGAVAQIDFKNFNVAKGQHVNYGFSNVSQTMINRVLGGNESKILGKITNSCVGGNCPANSVATGKVVLINPAGVMFGQGSTVDLNSFTVSTFDFNGARNLKGMSEAQIQAYQKTLNKMAPNSTNNNVSGNGQINFDSNYTSAFKSAGIDMNKLAGKTKITLDGTHFDKFTDNTNTKVASQNTNKSIDIVSDNITYKDSILKTGSNYNYGPNDKSYGNVRMVTADGVTFTYISNGYDNHMEVKDASKNVTRNITMNNSGLTAKNQTAIQSGDVRIINKSKGANSNIKIQNTMIKGTKLVNGPAGVVVVDGSKDVTVENSRIDTVNTSGSKNGVSKNTADQLYTTTSKDANGKSVTKVVRSGAVQVSAGENLKVSGSTVKTAGSRNAQTNNENMAGNVNFASTNGKLEVANTNVLSDGGIALKSTNNNVSVNNSLLKAEDSVKKDSTKDVTIKGKNQIDINNSTVRATNDINIYTTNTKDGKINIKSTQKDGKNQTLIAANEDLSIESNNTTIDNASLAYRQQKFIKYNGDQTSEFTSPHLIFYGNNTKGTNNVTIKNGTTFSPNGMTGGHTHRNINSIETNGNLTFDNASVKSAQVGLTVSDNGKVNGVSYKANITPEDAYKIDATSTKGNVLVNNSNMKAVRDPNSSTQGLDNNIRFYAPNGNFTQKNSKLTAYNDVTANNVGGKIDIVNSTSEATIGHIEYISSGAGDKGNITVTNSNLESAQHNHIFSTKGNKVTIDNSKVIAGSDRAGWDGANNKVKDPNDTEGNATIHADNGSVYIKNNSTIKSEDANVYITTKNQINFGDKENDANVNISKSSKIQAENNIGIKSTAQGIKGEKTTMPVMKYGNRLYYTAKKDNEFTSQDSLKSVNVNYYAEGANKIHTTKDAQFVNTVFRSQNNFVEAGGDVILNETTINVPDGVDPSKVKTQIFANGNVTTDDITGTMKADMSKAVKEFPQSVSTNRTGTGKSSLNLNKTKLVVRTDTVKDSANPNNGSISLDLKNASNAKAGVELTAQNVDKLSTDSTSGYFKSGYYKSGNAKYDNNIAAKQGPEVRLNATDNNISIAKITADKVTLDANDNKVADNTNGTATITVKDQKGFNLDPNLEYKNNKSGTGFTYTKDYNTKNVKTEGGKLTFDQWSDWKETGKITDSEGNVHTQYESTRDAHISEKTTTKIDQEHTVKFKNNNGSTSDFKLVYDKQYTVKEAKRDITAKQVKEHKVELPPGTTTDDFIKTREDICDKPEDNDGGFGTL